MSDTRVRKPRRLARRMAVIVTLVLLGGGAAQLAAAAYVVREKTVELRVQPIAVGLRLLRRVDLGAAPTDASLAAEFRDLDGFNFVAYDEHGRALARSRRDVPVVETLTPEALDAARATPDRPVMLTPFEQSADNAAVMFASYAGGVRYVGLFDRWTPSRIRPAVMEGFLAGFILNVLVGVIATRWLAHRVHSALVRAERVVHGMAAGQLDARLPDYGADAIGRLACDFNKMADNVAATVERLQREREMRRRSFADWTHEIATPLSSVLGYLESLQMPGFDEATRARYVDTAYECALALRALTDDLATLSQLDFDGLRLDRAPVDVCLLLQIETRALAPNAAAAGVEVALAPIAAGLSLLGDRQRLGQVLRNVLTNAIRHTPSGGRIELSAVARGEQVALEVEDDGPGIAEAHLAHLGERFYRPDGSRDRRTGGRGLGLAIARGIVEAHGGTLSIRSELAVGTRVIIEVPSGGIPE